jgi:hypothetical protein
MVDKILNIGSPVKDFVSSFLEQVNKGIGEQGFVFCKKDEAHAEMELSAIETKEVGGGIKIHIFSAGGTLEDTNSQKMKVYVKKPSQADIEEEKAKIEQAKIEQKCALPLAYRRAEAGK